MRQMSDNGIRLLTEWEGFETHIYKDAAGLPTIGVGHLLTQDERSSGKIFIDSRRVRYADGLTHDEVLDLFHQDIRPFERTVESGINVPLAEHQFDCLVSFCFNVGPGAFSNSSLRRLLNDGGYEEVPKQLRRWVFAAGKRNRGLVNRRRKEVKLWLGQ